MYKQEGPEVIPVFFLRRGKLETIAYFGINNPSLVII